MPTAKTDSGGGGSMGRRTFLRGVGATAAAGAGLAYADGPVGRAEAITPNVLGAAAGGAVVEWALRAFDAVGASSPDSGLTPSALKQDIYETALTRQSTNASTFIDNQNIISQLPNTLYVEGKLAAIEKLNEEAAKADVESAAQDAVGKYAATIEKNLLKTWNESVLELGNLISTVGSHSDVSQSDVFSSKNKSSYSFASASIAEDNSTVDLADGTSFDVHAPDVNHDYSGDVEDHYVSWSPINGSSGYAMQALAPDSGNLTYLSSDEWTGIWSELQNTISNVESGLTTWVNTVYDQVQAGDIEVSELITPRERAAMIAEDDGAAQAIADLQALGVPVDVENQATVTFSSTNATLRGTLALTDPDNQTLEAGTTYNPSGDSFTGDVYLTYDVSTGQGDWDAFTEGVDGGVATFGEEPYEDTVYRVDTSANETVSVDSGNFTPVDSGGTEVDPQNATAWETDLSDKLEQDITEITDVRFFADVDETQMETIKIGQEFTLEEITNTETEETKDSMTFEDSGEAQTDSNYITQEQWEDLEQQNKELIEKYEESQESNNDGLIPGIDIGGGTATAIAGVGVVGITIAVLKKAAEFYIPGY